MEIQSWQPGHQYDDDDDEENFLSGSEICPPPGKRLAPVGANDEDEMNITKDSDKEYSVESSPSFNTAGQMGSRFWGSPLGVTAKGGDNNTVNKELTEKVKCLERDQEELNNSLMSMTSHFAKVQFRLQQVVSAPSENKESLLMELQQFAFRGIPDISTPRSPLIDGVDSFDYNENGAKFNGQEETNHKSGHGEDFSSGPVSTQSNDEILASQRKKHAELIIQLKGQLEDLECYEYESGEGSVPSSILLERQKVVMEQLKARLNFNMDNLDKLTEDELKAEVDEAVGQLVTPLKMKSHLVNQLKTQIEDLENFIEFLQGEASTLVPVECTGCGTCSKHTSPTKSGGAKGVQRTRAKTLHKRTKSEQEELRKQTESILAKAMAVLQISTLATFGCGGEQAFYKNSLKKTPKGNHYGDLRAKLEIAVDHILDACSRVECLTESDTSRTGSATQESESDSQLEYLISSPEVAALVRKELAVAIRDLMHHGIITGAGRTVVGSIVPFMGCMSSKNTSRSSVGGGRSLIHAWDIILKFYELKMGHEYNAAPARKLSQSFGLDLSGSSSGNKQSLLATIGQIITSHSPYKRSADAKFKAFISSGLNKRKLIHWLRLVLRNQQILETYYSPWSYVSKTGFDDSFKTLERLNTFVFDLPVDVAIKQFKNMNEAF